MPSGGVVDHGRGTRQTLIIWAGGVRAPSFSMFSVGLGGPVPWACGLRDSLAGLGHGCRRARVGPSSVVSGQGLSYPDLWALLP